MENMLPKRHPDAEEYLGILEPHKQQLEDTRLMCGLLSYLEWIELNNFRDHLAFHAFYKYQKLLNKAYAFERLCERSHAGDIKSTEALLNYYFIESDEQPVRSQLRGLSSSDLE